MKQSFGAILEHRFVGWRDGGWRRINQESKGRRRWHDMEDAARKIENGGADSVEMLVTVLSEESREQLLNELMKKKQEPKEDVFEMEATKIRMSDFKQLDTNADGVRREKYGNVLTPAFQVIDSEEFENFIKSRSAPPEEPSMQQLWLVGTASAVPFIG